MIDHLINDILLAVSEMPDRSSPEDWPEAMIVTGDELREILESKLRPVFHQKNWTTETNGEGKQ